MGANGAISAEAGGIGASGAGGGGFTLEFAGGFVPESACSKLSVPALSMISAASTMSAAMELRASIGRELYRRSRQQKKTSFSGV